MAVDSPAGTPESPKAESFNRPQSKASSTTDHKMILLAIVLFLGIANGFLGYYMIHLNHSLGSFGPQEALYTLLAINGTALLIACAVKINQWANNRNHADHPHRCKHSPKASLVSSPQSKPATTPEQRVQEFIRRHEERYDQYGPMTKESRTKTEHVNGQLEGQIKQIKAIIAWVKEGTLPVEFSALETGDFEGFQAEYEKRKELLQEWKEDLPIYERELKERHNPKNTQ